jgi:hypothetical protein
MPGSNPFDVDLDDDVGGIDFLGSDNLIRRVLGRQQGPGEEGHKGWEDDKPDDGEWYDAE